MHIKINEKKKMVKSGERYTAVEFFDSENKNLKIDFDSDGFLIIKIDIDFEIAIRWSTKWSIYSDDTLMLPFLHFESLVSEVTKEYKNKKEYIESTKKQYIIC